VSRAQPLVTPQAYASLRPPQPAPAAAAPFQYSLYDVSRFGVGAASGRPNWRDAGDIYANVRKRLDREQEELYPAAATGLFMQLFTGRSGIHDLYAEKGFPVEVRRTGQTQGGLAARFADGTRYFEPTEPSNETNARVASWLVPAFRAVAAGASILNAARVAVGNVIDDFASGYASRAASDVTGGYIAVAPLPIGSMTVGGVGRGVAKKGAGKSLDDLSRVAATQKVGGFTQAGHSLQKHGSRPGSKWSQSDIDVNKPGLANARGQQLVDDVLTTPGSRVVSNPRGGTDVIAPDGRVIRYNRDGSFQGFRE